MTWKWVTPTWIIPKKSMLLLHNTISHIPIGKSFGFTLWALIWVRGRLTLFLQNTLNLSQTWGCCIMLIFSSLFSTTLFIWILSLRQKITSHITKTRSWIFLYNIKRWGFIYISTHFHFFIMWCTVTTYSIASCCSFFITFLNPFSCVNKYHPLWYLFINDW